MPETMVKAESSSPWKLIAALTLIAVILVTVLTVSLSRRLSHTASSASVEQVRHLLDREDCIAHINASFFAHLADALSKEPASTQRQDFLNQMKTDAGALTRLDATCAG